MFALSIVLTSSVSFAGDESLRTCNQPRNGIVPENMPWLPNGATKNACDQAIISWARQSTNALDTSDKVAAFKDGKLVGIRDSSNLSETPLSFDPEAWQESSSVGPVGELWWGRSTSKQVTVGQRLIWSGSKSKQVFVGQESYWRLSKGTYRPAPAELAQQLANLRRQVAALKNKQTPPPPLVEEDVSGLFPSKMMSYNQIAATMTTFEGGAGGDGDIPLGKVSNAKLQLDTSPILKGVLSLDLEVDGTTRTFTFPLMRNVTKSDAKGYLNPEQKYRLRGAAIVNGESYRCEDRPVPPKTNNSAECPFSNAVDTEYYDAYGAFFGDHAALVAIQFTMQVNSPKRNRGGATASGIVILKAGPLSSSASATELVQVATATPAPTLPPVIKSQAATQAAPKTNNDKLAHAWLAREDELDAVPVTDCTLDMRPYRNPPGPEPERSQLCDRSDLSLAQSIEYCSVAFLKRTELCFMATNNYIVPQIVLLTSTQTSCPFCITTNTAFQQFGRKHYADERGKAHFMQFTWNPWSAAFLEPVNPGITQLGINGLPTIVAIKKGKIVGRINGATSVEEIEKLLVRVKK